MASVARASLATMPPLYGVHRPIGHRAGCCCCDAPGGGYSASHVELHHRELHRCEQMNQEGEGRQPARPTVLRTRCSLVRTDVVFASSVLASSDCSSQDGFFPPSFRKRYSFFFSRQHHCLSDITISLHGVTTAIMSSTLEIFSKHYPTPPVQRLPPERPPPLIQKHHPLHRLSPHFSCTRSHFSSFKSFPYAEK
jgi:hypothetical protein